MTKKKHRVAVIAGGLRFKDFFRPGIFLPALAFAVCMLLLPLIYPFYPAHAGGATDAPSNSSLQEKVR